MKRHSLVRLARLPMPWSPLALWCFQAIPLWQYGR